MSHGELRPGDILPTTLFISNLDWGLTSAGLAEIFGRWGEVVSATIHKDKATGRSQGWGRIEMATEQQARLALAESKGGEISDRPIRIQFAKVPRPPHERPQRASRVIADAIEPMLAEIAASLASRSESAEPAPSGPDSATPSGDAAPAQDKRAGAPTWNQVTVTEAVLDDMVLDIYRDYNNINWLTDRNFELYIAHLLQHNGMKVAVTRPKHDGGFDILAEYEDTFRIRQVWAVECKLYRGKKKVDRPTVERLLGSRIVGRGRANPMMVTSSFFTRGALEITAEYRTLSLQDQDSVKLWTDIVAGRLRST